MQYIKEILKNNKRLVLIYLAMGIFNAFMSNFKADFFQKVIDGLTARSITLYEILAYGIVLFINFGMNYLDEYPSKKLENGIYLDFKLLALGKISKISYSEYQKIGTGKLVQQIENGANAGKNVTYDFWFTMIRNLIPTVLFSIYFIWKINRTITYCLMAGYLLIFLITNLLLKGLYQIKEKILNSEEELNHFLVRGFMEMLVFRMNHQFPNEIKKATSAKKIIVSSKVKMNMIHEAFFTIFALLVGCLDIGVLIYAWKTCSLSVGSVVALIVLIDNAYTPIAIFNVIYVQYRLNRSAWNRFVDFLELENDVQLQNGISFHSFSKEIAIKNLSFSYEGRQIFDHLNLTIHKGEKVAFVGESGSGKSTLIKLLAGLLKYEHGDIFFDDTPLKEISLESFYEKISYFPQDASVFDGTIRENIVFDGFTREDTGSNGSTREDTGFDTSSADQKIYESLENTQLLSLVNSLEEGLDTRIGEKGTCFSGGEKQRLALSRLWFKNSDLIILDESTSALDNLTENIVMKNVMKQLAHSTVIAIAHRLTSITEFDRILVFQNGSIVGDGTFEELLIDNEYFATLYNKEFS